MALWVLSKKRYGVMKDPPRPPAEINTHTAMEHIDLSTSTYSAMSDDDGVESSSGQVQSFKQMTSDVRSNDDDNDDGSKDDDDLKE